MIDDEASLDEDVISDASTKYNLTAAELEGRGLLIRRLATTYCTRLTMM